MTLPEPIKLVLVEGDDEQRALRVSQIEDFATVLLLQSFATVEEAIQTVPGFQPQIVLLDMSLPETSVLECIRTLRFRMPGLKIMLLTTAEQRCQAFEALKAGATGYIDKHLDPKILIERVQQQSIGGATLGSFYSKEILETFQKPLPSADPELHLTELEWEILQKSAKGYRFLEIADLLTINTYTLKRKMGRILEKLHAHTKAQAACQKCP